MKKYEARKIDNVGYWSLLIESNTVFLSTTTKKIFGSKKTTLPLEDFLNFFHFEAREKINRFIIKLLKEKIPFTIECPIKTNTGKELWIHISAAPAIEDESNSLVTKITGNVRSIIDELDEEYRSRTFYKILDELAIISITDVKGQIIYVNDLFLKISGYTLSELIGQNHRIVKSGQHSKEFYKNIWNTITSKKPWHGEITNKKKNGELYIVDAHIYPIFDYKNEITEYISVRFDITEKKLKIQQEIIQAKFQMVGETSAQIMHDVMNPLAIIRLSVESLVKQIHNQNEITNDQLLKKTSTMKDSCDRIKKIFKNMQDLLDNRVDIERIDVEACIANAIAISESKLKKEMIKISMENNSTDSHVVMNYQQLLQVLLNVINNSTDAIEKLEEKWIKFLIEDTEDFLLVAIIDSGNGIKKELHEKIFESLFTTKDKNTGTGLGLSICKRIIENAAGKILINEESLNTRIDIYLKKSSAI